MVPISTNRAAHRGGVEQGVDEVVVQQVDLVDVEQPAVRGGQQARLEVRDAFGQRALQVQGADDAVLGRADRQLDQLRRAAVPGGVVVRAVRAERVGGRGIAGEPAAVHDVHARQQTCQRADHGRLRGALLAAHQHPADGGRDRGQDERQAQVRQPDDGGERVRLQQRSSSSATGRSSHSARLA
jgi:hypothetical protein